jgi:hypothetical protein
MKMLAPLEEESAKHYMALTDKIIKLAKCSIFLKLELKILH